MLDREWPFATKTIGLSLAVDYLRHDSYGGDQRGQALDLGVTNAMERQWFVSEKQLRATKEDVKSFVKGRPCHRRIGAGGSLMLLFIILETMGLTDQQVAVIVALALGINPILDMFETMNNITGDLVCSYAVATREGLVDTSTTT
jgi:hypothetical protein